MVKKILLCVGLGLIVVGVVTLGQTAIKFDGVVFTCGMVEIIFGCLVAAVVEENMK